MRNAECGTRNAERGTRNGERGRRKAEGFNGSISLVQRRKSIFGFSYEFADFAFPDTRHLKPETKRMSNFKNISIFNDQCEPRCLLMAISSRSVIREQGRVMARYKAVMVIQISMVKRVPAMSSVP